MGQRWVTIHPVTYTGTTPLKSIRKRTISFGISISQRVRDIPNDRFGEIAYMESLAMASVLEDLIPVIESNTALTLFANALKQIKISPSQTDPAYDPENPPSSLPSKYQTSGSFIFHSMNLDPKHLYPSDFLTRAGNDKEQLYDKIAGYQFTAMFDSPPFEETYPPLQCKPKYQIIE